MASSPSPSPIATAAPSFFGAHALHVYVFGAAFLVFFLLAARLYWKEYKRTGRWQMPK